MPAKNKRANANRKGGNSRQSQGIDSTSTGVAGFDEAYYLAQNPDVAAAVRAGIFSSGYDHFSKLGAKELREPNSGFDSEFYINENPDVLAAVAAGAVGSAFEHYQKHGVAEGRKPSKDFVSRTEFDYNQYLSENPDLIAAGITTHELAYVHYVIFGSTEGRSAKSTSGLSLLNGIPQAPIATPVQRAVPVGDGGGGGGTPTSFYLIGPTQAGGINTYRFGGNATGLIAMSDQNSGNEAVFTRSGIARSVTPNPSFIFEISLDSSAPSLNASTYSGAVALSVVFAGSGNASVIGSPLIDDVTGGNGDDIIRGNNGADILDGGSGNDIITGGPGTDSIFLGPGTDTLVFGGTGSLGAIVGTVTQVESNIGWDFPLDDYSVADDSIHLSQMTFGSVATGNLGALSPSKFSSVANGGTVVGQNYTNGGFVYDEALGNLIYVTADMSVGSATDQLGLLTYSGAGKNAQIIGTFGPSGARPMLTVGEFTVVA